MLHDPQFWVLIAFIIFIISVFKPIKKILISNLDNKINEIKNNIDQAEKIKNEAQRMFNEINKRQNEVKQEMQVIQNNTNEKIISIEKIFNKKLIEQKNKFNNLAKAKINQMIRDTNTEVQSYIVEKAIKTTIKILEKKLNQSDKQKLINKSVVELNSILKH